MGILEDIKNLIEQSIKISEYFPVVALFHCLYGAVLMALSIVLL